MEENDLKKLKQINLEIIKYFDKFCRENNINYWMDGGTLLGAVRHKGFIPWDDDIDIGMLRNDYNKFLEKYNEENEFFVFQSLENDSNYPHAFGKFGLKGSVLLEKDTPSEFKQKISIDIFPFDNAPNNLLSRKIQKFCTKYVKILIYKKSGYKFSFEKKGIIGSLFGQLLLFFSRIFSKKVLIKLLNYSSQKYNAKKTNFVFSVGTNYTYEDKLFPYEVVSELTELPFENIMLFGPKDWDFYLKQMLNDYMSLPPIEKQVTHHEFIKLDFGENFGKILEKVEEENYEEIYS
ncbi:MULTISPECIES: LicD family protein [unclassified Enterococcus]|uniref:LicD family protein n=1 Tax=unclassified Enterococcus TaxID=2608891 RepID=UPI00259B0C64|nr:MULTISPECIES: LicD family protein [unclassified Enterococcus]MDO0918219.1 LicD family protein [Enterococcus sp. B1E2]WIV16591.1 LicD family protein [Enterococcus sp. FZMF]